MVTFQLCFPYGPSQTSAYVNQAHGEADSWEDMYSQRYKRGKWSQRTAEFMSSANSIIDPL